MQDNPVPITTDLQQLLMDKTTNQKFKSIDEYISALPNNVKNIVEEIRLAVILKENEIAKKSCMNYLKIIGHQRA